MGWPFCPKCHTILSVDAGGTVSCARCPYRTTLIPSSSSSSSHGCDNDDDNNNNPQRPPSTTTVSSDTPVPLWAKSDEEQRMLQAQVSSEPSRATVEEPCIKCNAKEVGFYTVQLRSVDEGQTVFYECPECRHTWSVNN